ncbi:hypothetical protein [Amycolatopsis sp. NPDC051071]|uniref:hypothetical protein n=1 Tax=Amycolatopsis sp. NPDC051071 TaxID=3154637 RepID=UPI00343DADE5
MSSNYYYWAIVGRDDSLEDPNVVVRTRSDGRDEEVFTIDLEWRRSDSLRRIQYGRDYNEALPISEEDFRRFEKRRIKRVKEGWFNSDHSTSSTEGDASKGSQYFYWAIVTDGHSTEEPVTVVRARGNGNEMQEFTTELTWEPTRWLYRMLDERGPDKDAVPITEEEALRFAQIQASSTETRKRQD